MVIKETKRKEEYEHNVNCKKVYFEYTNKFDKMHSKYNTKHNPE